jgi:L-cysteate sulfo-lyase
MISETLRANLNTYPRLRYGSTPTPLEPLPRLTQALGGPSLWIKRDDGFGPGMGGNKGRKLEFLMAEALQQRRRKVVTFGGLQSNHARMTAAACAALGLQAHLFFFEKRPSSLSGNLMLDQLLGAKLHFIPFGGGGDASMTLETTNRLVRLVASLWVGPGAYFIPVGGHTVTGCLGYVAAAWEIHEQVMALGLPAEKVTLLTAVGTGGTLAGLMAGVQLIRSPIKLLGIDVGKLWKAFPASLARLASELCVAIDQPHRRPRIEFVPEDVPLVEHTYVGPGYGVATAAGGRAIQTLAQHEGILLDPIYTGKAFAGLLDLVRKGAFGVDEHLIFLHTGGYPGLWPFAEAMMAAGQD